MEKRCYFDYEDGGKAFFWSFLLPVILVFLFTFIVSDTESIAFLISSSVIMQGTFIAYYFLYSSFKHISPFKAGRITPKINLWFLPIIIVLSGICIFGFNGIVSCIDELIASTGYVSESVFLPLNNLGDLFLNIFLVAVLPAIGEELIFRGIIQTSLMRKYSKHIAIILCAILFSLFHGNIMQTFYQFIMGIILGYTAYLTGSLLASMLLHFLNNLLVLLLTYFNVLSDNIIVDGKYIGISFACLAAAIAMLVCLYYFIKKVVLKNRQPNNAPERQVSEGGSAAYGKSIYYIIAIIAIAICWVCDLIFGIVGI